MILLPQMGKIKLKIFITISTCTLLLSMCLPLISSQTAHALVDPGSANDAIQLEDVADRGLSWSVMSLLDTPPSSSSTSQRCWLAPTISLSDVNSGNILQKTGSVPIGSDVVGSSGQTNCTGSWVAQVLSLWGYPAGNYGLFLTAMGYKLTGNYYDGTSKNSDGSLAYQDGNQLISLIPSNFFETTDRSHIDQDVLYWIYYNNFVNGCGATQGTPLSEASNDEIQQAKSEDKSFIIEGVDGTTGQVAQYIFNTTNSASTKVTVGYGIGATNATMTCKQLANNLNNQTLAQTYANTLQQEASEGISDPNAMTATSTTNSQNNTAGCEGSSALGWLLCPILLGMDHLVDEITSSVIGLLSISPSDYGANGTTNPLYTAWSAIRIISTLALVGIALFVIISQILGFEFLSAYSVKKIVPKLVAAVIFIQLSWILITLGIAVIDSISRGIGDLILAPFGQTLNGGIYAIMKQGSFSGVTQSIGFIGIIGLGVAAFASAGYIFGVLAAALVIFIAVIIAVATLVLRKIIIIALLAISPIAIIAWILPGTEKFWKMWWSNLSKLLLMFPLIIGLLAVGQMFASITASSKTPSIINYFVILIAYYGPFFLIPKTFSMGGSLMSSVSSSLGNLNKKLASADFGGLKRKANANKEMRKEAKRAAGFDDLGSKNQLRQLRGKWRTDQLGGAIPQSVLGKNLSKRLPGGMYRKAYNQRLLRGAAAGEELADKNAQLEWNAAFGEKTHPQLMAINRDIKDRVLNGDTEYKYTDKNGNEQTMLLNSAMARISMSDATERKQEDVLDAYDADAKSENNIERTANWNKFRTKTGFGKLDKRMTDLTRGKIVERDANGHVIDVVDREKLSLAVSSIDDAKFTDPATIGHLDENNNMIKPGRANNWVEALKLIKDKGTEDDLRYVAATLTTLGQRDDLHNLDPGLLAELGKIAPGVADKVVLSGGNLRMDYDPETNSLVAKSSSEV